MLFRSQVLLDGLTDEEYLWEPVPGCWSIRPAGAQAAPRAVGAGRYRYEFAYPEPEAVPVTTIAWRLAHIIVGLFASRNATHFGGLPADWPSWEYAATADAALKQLDEAQDAWIAGVRGLGARGLARPVGPEEGGGQYADCPMAELVLHIHREVIHHGAEISLLRDLYLWKGSRGGL